MHDDVDPFNGQTAQGGTPASTDTNPHQSLQRALATAVEEAVRLRAERIEERAEAVRLRAELIEAARRLEEAENNLSKQLKKQVDDLKSADEATRRREALFAALEEAVKLRAERIELEAEANMKKLEEAGSLRLENLFLKQQVEELKSTVAPASSLGKPRCV